MFDKVSEAAERLAVHVSRRDFFGWAGKSALALAGVVGGVLAFPANANADQKSCWKCVTGASASLVCDVQQPNFLCFFLYSGCSRCKGTLVSS